METRIRRLPVTAVVAALFFTAGVKAQDGEDVLGEIVSPDLERREIREAKLDTENIELSAFGGVINVEDFGSNSVRGGALAYHINEDLFMEAAYGETEVGESSFERLSGSAPLLTDEQRKFSYYNLSLGWNLFPGEYFIFDKWALNSSLYLIAGVGNTSFADEEHFTYNFGVGARILMNDWLTLRLDFRDHVFEHEIFGEVQTTNNLSAQCGISIFF